MPFILNGSNILKSNSPRRNPSNALLGDYRLRCAVLCGAHVRPLLPRPWTCPSSGRTQHGGSGPFLSCDAAWSRDARRQELHSPMPPAGADLAGTGRRAAEAAAEIPANKIWDHASTDLPPLRALIHRYLSVPFEQSAETACASRYFSTAASCPSARIAS
jgi:hypothetical protein